MKVNLIFFVLLLSVAAMFSQTMSGTVEYGIADVNVVFKEGNLQNDNIKNIIASAKKQIFSLKFNDMVSSFSLTGSLNSEGDDESAARFAKILYTTNETFFCSKKDNTLYRKIVDNIIIKQDSLLYNWEITSESKKISNYTCYKALLKKYIINRLGVKKERIITAWFTPDLPFNFGSIGYNSLPGLILELNENYTTYLAKKITLSETAIKIQLPKGPYLTQDQYDNKLLKNN